jgi:hypothetical protein
MPLSGRVGHTLVLGTTRVGKTRLAELLITQDIRRGDVVIAFDPKGDADLLIGCMWRPAAPGGPFYVFHLGFPAHLGALQPDRGVLTHHRGGHPHRRAPALRRQFGRLQGVRLALRQRPGQGHDHPGRAT